MFVLLSANFNVRFPVRPIFGYTFILLPDKTSFFFTESKNYFHKVKYS